MSLQLLPINEQVIVITGASSGIGLVTAVKHMRERGGALINVGSALSDRAIPLQRNYCAAKHALKAVTDTLRMELKRQGSP